MNLSKRGEYALRVLLELAMARSAGIPLVPLAVIVRTQNIPANFLEQILASLRQAGHLNATRGKRGGYSLAPATLDVSVGSLVRFLDGPLAPIACASLSAYKRCTCPDESRCGVRHLMIEARNALSSVLDGITLGALAERTLAPFTAAGEQPALIRELLSPAKKSGEPEYSI